MMQSLKEFSSLLVDGLNPMVELYQKFFKWYSQICCLALNDRGDLGKGNQKVRLFSHC